MKRLHKQGLLEFVKKWRKTSFLSEERLAPREKYSAVRDHATAVKIELENAIKKEEKR